MKRSVKKLRNQDDSFKNSDGDVNVEEEEEVDDDIFYLPKKKRSRYISVKPETQKHTGSQVEQAIKPVSYVNKREKEQPKEIKPQTAVRIIECNNSSETESTRSDITREYVSHVRLLAGKKDNALVTAFFAINIFLQPRNVYSTTLYWISQYVNYKKSNQIHWFTDHIYKLMKYPVDFNMTATRGVSDFHSKEVKYNLLIHTIGSSLHKIPCEYFIIQSNESMLRSITHLINPSNECFITNRHHGLKGELEVDSFQYNGIMNFFYEPSFFIITSYLLYTYQLFFATGGRNILDYTNILDMIIIPLKQLESCTKLGCLTESSTNYESKKSIFIQDMKELLNIYESNALCAEAIISGLKELWSKKATYCFNIVPERYLAIHKQLY